VLERFHTPQGLRNAVQLPTKMGPQRMPDQTQWSMTTTADTRLNGQQEEKTTFKIQHLMNRSAAAFTIQAMLTDLQQLRTLGG
jgi:hypothetical protein